MKFYALPSKTEHHLPKKTGLSDHKDTIYFSINDLTSRKKLKLCKKSLRMKKISRSIHCQCWNRSFAFYGPPNQSEQFPI